MDSRWVGIDEFVHVVEMGSFTGAADRMGVSKAFISKQVSMLEDRLKVRLLQRTTRKLTLTEVGEVFYRQCQAMLELYEQAESAIADIQKQPRGTLKLALNSRFGVEYMAGAIAAFSRAYPDLSVEVHSSFGDGTTFCLIMIQAALAMSTWWRRVAISPSATGSWRTPRSSPGACGATFSAWWRRRSTGRLRGNRRP